MNESSSVVHELVESLIDEAVTISDWDAATIGKRIYSQPGARDVKCGCRVGEEGVVLPVDVCDLVRRLCPQRQLVSYSLRGGRSSDHLELLQLKCAEQRFPGYCGHYALHFALCLLEAFRSRQEEVAMGYVTETGSAGAYWRRYWFSVSQLMVKASVDDWWPWTEDYVYTGDMERSFLRYLLSTDPHVQFLQGEDKIVVMQYCYGTFQDNFSTLCEIQEKINSFYSTSSPSYLVFILGVTNHWVTVIAYRNACTTHQYSTVRECLEQKNKASDNSPENRIGIVYLDSNNVPVLGYNDADIVRHVEEAEKRELEKKGKGFTEWDRAMYRQALIDQREVVLRLAQALSGKTDLRSEMMQDYVDRMLESFGFSVVKKMNGSPGMYLPLLVEWLENCYTAGSLHQNLGQMLAPANRVHGGSLSHLHDWLQDNQARLCGIEESGIQCVDQFKAMVTNINHLLESHLRNNLR